MIKTFLGLIGGASSFYRIGATLVVIGGVVWYFYHSIVAVPIEEVEAKLESCRKNVKIKDAALSEAGRVISGMGQKIYDINQSIKPKLIDGDIRLIECREELDKARRNSEKIDTSDDFYYTKLPF